MAQVLMRFVQNLKIVLTFSAGKFMLLIATIDPVLRENLQENLTQKNEPFLLLEEGENIIDSVFRHTPSMVVLDLYLTHPSGLEILRELRSKGFSGKVVLLGGQSAQTLAPEASRLGAIQIVGRPFNANQVLGAVRVASGDLDQDLD
jgi:two-component system response regulator FixJ